ncbi:extensin-like [Mizuhopecten yessoensis]|uniref:Uncharacterized protein n=1 Tax=Mizuhopecten yessoensis TaxID=6573 RepID=A0A210QMT6_MIZYE|nr:extensin-like [Mizuhopecten yessoensis]OWF50046.1 hypothetical protein KP79_PYT23500 [Mizuhopecten yessoensis]
MAVNTILLGFLFLSLVDLASSQGVRVSFSQKQNAKTQFSGKPNSQVFSAKNSQRFNGRTSFGSSRSRSSQRFHGSPVMVTGAPFRRQYPSSGRTSFINRRGQIVTNAPFTNRQIVSTPRPWVGPNSQISNADPYRSGLQKRPHPMEQNAIQPPKNLGGTFRPVMQQFVQTYQYNKEPITTQLPPVTVVQRFTPPNYAFGSVNQSPAYRFEPSVQPQRSNQGLGPNQGQGNFRVQNQNNRGQNQQQHPMAERLIQRKPPPPPSQQIRQAQGMMANGNKGRGNTNKQPMKAGINNRIMNNPPPQMLANNVPLFQKPQNQNGNMRSNPNPRRQGGNRRANGQGKNYNWLNKRKPQRRPAKKPQRPRQEMTTPPQQFNQQPFDAQGLGFPFNVAPSFSNHGPTPPTKPPAAPTKPNMFPPTQPSPFGPTFPPPTDPFFMPTTANPTTRLTPPSPSPTRLVTPKTTMPIDGIGHKCFHTGECSAGCCYGKSGTMLDTDTFGPNALKNGLVAGTCQMKQPGLGETCDDLCICQSEFECYRRYKPNYKEGKLMAQNSMYEPPAPPTKPRRTCMRKAVALAERWSFWKCYFDTACSGPLLK